LNSVSQNTFSHGEQTSFTIQRDYSFAKYSAIFATMLNMAIPEKLQIQLKELPNQSGVYFFKNAQGEVLYIGKATSLRSRVRSYFQGDMMSKRGPLIEQMVNLVDTVEVQVTDSVLEALVLESYRIKREQPQYNTHNKSQRSFAYLVITNEEYPRLLVKRERDILEKRIGEKILYSFGPFTSKRVLFDALKIIRKIFPYRSNRGTYDERSNVYQQIGLVPGSSQTKDEYRQTIEQIRYFFEGKKKRVVSMLEKQMNEYAKNLEFEKADQIKKRLFALRHIHDVALMGDDMKIAPLDAFRIEGYDISHMFGDSMVGVMVVIKQGEPDTDQYRQFNIKSFEGINDLRALEEVLTRRLARTEWAYPDCILVDGGVVHKRRIEKVLREHNVSIPVIAAKKNKQHKVEALIGQKKIIETYKADLLLANVESHRFAIKLHRQKRTKRDQKKWAQ